MEESGTFNMRGDFKKIIEGSVGWRFETKNNIGETQLFSFDCKL